MKDFLLKTFIRLRHDDSGVTLVEYGIAIAVALGIGALTLGTLSNEISGSMTAAGTAMPD